MKKIGRSRVGGFISVCLTLMLIWLTGFSCYATTQISPEQAKKNLTTAVQSSMAGDTFETTDGGYIAGSDLFTGDATNGYDVNEGKLSQLTGDEQTRFVNQLATSCNEQVALEKGEINSTSSYSDGGKVTTTTVSVGSKSGITDETVDSWWKNLQSKQGIGSKFLATILADTKPDFVTGSKWYKPFSGPISTLLGFGSIIAMGLIGLVMVCDILYITIPPIRLFVDDQGGEGKVQVSKIFSHAAIHAVKTVEEGGGADSGKHALGIYFKSRVIELVILGICLLYLVNGQIYSLIGYILDLLSGITG